MGSTSSRPRQASAPGSGWLQLYREERGKGARVAVSKRHVSNVKHSLGCVIGGSGFERLRDLNREAVERWVTGQQQKEAAPAARTLNAHLAALTAFGNWCVQTRRLVANPFDRLAKLDEKADRRRERRALTEAELQRLLRVAQVRPLAEYGRESEQLPPAKQQGRSTWTKKPLAYDDLDRAEAKAREVLADKPDLIARLERTGR